MLRISSKKFWHDRDSNSKLTACEPRTSIFFAHLQKFGQLLQTAKNKTTVLILVFKEFLQTSVPPLIFLLYAGGCHDFLMKKLFSQCRKTSEGTPTVFEKILVSKSFVDEKRGITFFRRTFSVSQCWKTLWASLQGFKKIGISKNFMHDRWYHKFPSKIVCFTVPKNFVREPNSVSLISGFKKCWG